MKAVIILGNINQLNTKDIEGAFIIGADRGALNAIQNGITPDVSIGDFDSVSLDELEAILSNSKRVIKLNPIKDKTDTEEAIDLCLGYDEIEILGGIRGKRIEHFYSILLYLFRDKRITMRDENSKIVTMDQSFQPLDEYTYMSLFSIEGESVISVSGMKYNLDHYTLKFMDPLGVSNQIEFNPWVEIHSGRLLVIYSKEDHEKL